MFPPSLAHRGRGHEGAISALPSPLTAKIVPVRASCCCDSGQRARGGGAQVRPPPYPWTSSVQTARGLGGIRVPLHQPRGGMFFSMHSRSRSDKKKY